MKSRLLKRYIHKKHMYECTYIWGTQIMKQELLSTNFAIRARLSHVILLLNFYCQTIIDIECILYVKHLYMYWLFIAVTIIHLSVVVQSLSLAWFFAIPCTAACQASLSFTVSWSSLKLMSVESVMPSNQLLDVTMTNHLMHLLEWPNSKILRAFTVKDMEQEELSFIACGNAKWYNHTGRQFISVLKTKHTPTVWASNCTPWYPKKVKIYVHTKTRTWMSTAALFITKT